jgi:hypothetical protein
MPEDIHQSMWGGFKTKSHNGSRRGLGLGTYIDHCNKMEDEHHDFISEFIGGTKKTVGLTDISIIALAKTLNLPVVSMESPVTSESKKLHIPDVCKLQSVEHLTFSEFLRKEQLKF